MKFLFVGTNPEYTGAATHFVALIQAMAQAGHAVGVVAYPDGLIAQELARCGIAIQPGKFRNAFDVRGYARVLGVARRAKPDWLVGNFGKEYWPLIVIGRLLGIPVALFRHRNPPMKSLSARWVPRLARRFFAVSNYARQAYLDRGTPASLVRVLYNPVNTQLCCADPSQRNAIRSELGIDEDAIVLGYAGRMHRGKGIFSLFEAASEAMEREPRLHCLWLGDGPGAAELRERIAGRGMAARHHMVGWVHAVQPYYSAMSFLAFPSLVPETFGRVSVEAQAAGVPVLASNVGGIPETLVSGMTGLLLPPGDVPAWRDAILQMCGSSCRAPMAAAARTFVLEHFSMAVIAAEFVKSLVDV